MCVGGGAHAVSQPVDHEVYAVDTPEKQPDVRRGPSGITHAFLGADRYSRRVSAYTPSETSRRSGFSLDTLRYYEKIGLLADVARTSGGRRVFTDDDLGWLTLLRCLRDTGMPIAQMCRYAELARDGDYTAEERMRLLEEHAGVVERQIELLRNQQQHLHEKIAYYRALTGRPAVEADGARLTE